MTSPIATRSEAIARLSACLPMTGSVYAQWRNTDFGPGGGNRVSGLSPWLRHRFVLESDVIDAAVAEHGIEAAEKFIQEVCWRSYWKGFLERRPVHWHDYCEARSALIANARQYRDLGARLARAEHGQTGIECFDSWVNELIEFGYLHNHARMWFASIWIFTLELPWALGADFFLRHLLDGDPASNTLSWRWIAGYHTPGKTYLARASNIARYTNHRFSPGHALANDAPAPEGVERPPLEAVPRAVEWSCSEQTGLLITEEDLNPESLFGHPNWAATIALQATQSRSPHPVADQVDAFSQQGLTDALGRNEGRCPLGVLGIDTPRQRHQVCALMRQTGVQEWLTPWVPTGPSADALGLLSSQLQADGIYLKPVPRDWDLSVWPHATHGFFRFWKAIGPMLADR